MNRVYRILLALGAMVPAVSGVRAEPDAYRSLGYLYLSPLPASEYNLTQTKFVLVRFKDISPATVTNLSQFIQVTGASSGLHTGQTKIASDNRTVIFEMSTGFQSNELVTVNLAPQTPSGAVQPYQYQFMISGHMPDPPAIAASSEVVPNLGLTPRVDAGGLSSVSDISTPAIVTDQSPPTVVGKPGVLKGTPTSYYKAASPGVTGIMPNGVSVPSDFPHINITTNNNPDSGLIFINNQGSGQAYNVIFDNSGSPVWYLRTLDRRRDMKVQPNGMLTMVTHVGWSRHIGLNNHYEEVASYSPVNGYGMDEHEIQMLADGTYFLICWQPTTVDLSRYISGGNTNASVNATNIQQFTPQGELIFQWRAWDHLDVAGQQFPNVDPTNPWEFPHMNAIAVDSDGHILVSSRNLSEVTKINADTGEVIWRLGGTHSDFIFVNDPLNGPRNQHAIRALGNNRYTLFDNGDGHSPQVSRAVEYELNPSSNPKTATVVWQYPTTPTTSLYSYYMGNCQRLPNGNTLINWAIGNLPKLTEIRPDGTKAFEMNWVNGDETYRVWRCAWQGVALKPYLILESYPDNVTLLFNQFGDTNIATYRIYGGTSPQPTTLLASSTATMKQFTNLTKGQTYYFRVSAVNNNGVEGTFSNEESIVANTTKPGQNLLTNGDFSISSDNTSWTPTVTSPAAATWAVISGVSTTTITGAGTAASQIQLYQAGIPVILGNTYVFEFDAWTSSGPARSIEAKVTSASGASYLTIAPTPQLSSIHSHFRNVFTMTAAADFNARVVFNMGGNTKPVYIDNVLLFNPAPGDLNQDGKVDLLDLKLMTTDWRKTQSGLSADLNADDKVDFKDVGIMGDNWSPSP